MVLKTQTGRSFEHKQGGPNNQNYMVFLDESGQCSRTSLSD